MSKRKTRVLQVLASAAALASLGYTISRRAAPRLVPATRAHAGRSHAPASTRGTRDIPPTPVVAPEPLAWDDGARISSAPDALDVALDLEGVFDAEPESGVEVTARLADHAPAPFTGDDEEAPSPDDLGRAFLTHATESEHSASADDVVPELESLAAANDEYGEADDESEADRETVRQYLRSARKIG